MDCKSAPGLFLVSGDGKGRMCTIRLRKFRGYISGRGIQHRSPLLPPQQDCQAASQPFASQPTPGPNIDEAYRGATLKR
jgi:hypothetical protein